jgi:alpha-mannosidase
MDLVDMMDGLLDVLETEPEYRAFYLDSQTVILEDYLEVRPENEARIRALVEAGRLQIGPWYTLPDEWGCPGEALVRNLLIGHRVAKRFGPVSKVGYTPFSNGQISQLPQLYRGFGIDSVFFYRGIGKHVAKSEFIWEGPDGSRLFAFRFGDYARYNYYYLIYRPGLLGRFPSDRDYTWNPEEVPFRVANDQSWDRQYGWMHQKLHVYPDNLKRALGDGVRFTAPDARTRHLLYMMGHDHSFAAREELDLIRALRETAAPEDGNVFHSALDDYMRAFRAEARDLEVLRGEMRHTLKDGLWTTLMAHILSCRLYLKQRNARICAELTGNAEPLAALAWLTGSRYPSRILEIAWKKVLVNHAHDAIGGCSTDKVHEEMMARWGEVETINDELIRRSMRDVAGRVDGISTIAPTDLQLTVFNTLARPRSGVCEFVVDIPGADPSEPFFVESPDGAVVPMQVLGSEPCTPTIEGGYELTMPLSVARHRVLLDLSDLPPLGWRAYAIRRGQQTPIAQGSLVREDGSLENEFLRVDFNPNGTLRVTDKLSGQVADHLFYFEDTGELGDPWNRVLPAGDKPLMSLETAATRQAIICGPLSATVRVEVPFAVPVAADKDGRRAEQTTDLGIRLEVTLRRGARAVEVTVFVNNTARDHRLRVMMPSGIADATHSTADGQFDVLQRPIRLPDAQGWKEQPYPTHPMWSFVDVTDGERGLAVLQDGLTEYEVVDDAARTIAITLLRAFGKFVWGRPTPGAQCLGQHFYRFALVPHRGTWVEAGLPSLAAEHVTRVYALESAPTRGTLPREQSVLRIEPDSLVLSGVKQSEAADAVVVRFWNPLPAPVQASVCSDRVIKAARRLTLEELDQGGLSVERVAGSASMSAASQPDCGGHRVVLTAGAKEIVTLGLQFGG